MGGTRFVGKCLISRLCDHGNELTVFTRGRNPVPHDVEHLLGDRTKIDDLAILKGRKFDVIVDSSGRSLEDTKSVLLLTGEPNYRFLYVSSAGVYADSDVLPLKEDSPLDPLSRHSGKAHTENWLRKEGVPFTSFRPTYIYGPGNYNPIEKWFFDRIIHNRPIPLPGDGSTITQLGHVKDLADAMSKSLLINKSKNQIYNCSGASGITFSGLIRLSAIACDKDPDSVETITFDPSSLNSKERKVFPLRLNHFLTNIQRVQNDLQWKPSFDLATGLRDSYLNDYSLLSNVVPDFSLDQKLFGG